MEIAQELPYVSEKNTKAEAAEDDSTEHVSPASDKAAKVFSDPDSSH